MGNFFGTGAGWVFAFFIVGATIVANRRLRGLGLAKFNREVPGELDGKAASANVAVPVVPQETKTLFDRADELLKQGTQSEDNRALIEAIDTYRRGLALLARPESPLQWALAHTNLAAALETLGKRESGTARIEEAVEAYREALKEYTRARVPLEWATTQNNLGTALKELGKRETGLARLAEAVEAHREAARELTRERVPLQWAVTQHNLAVVYRDLYEKDREPGHLDDAIEAVDGALEEFRTANKSRLIEMADPLREKILAAKSAL